jgi:hypothetical protein
MITTYEIFNVETFEAVSSGFKTFEDAWNEQHRKPSNVVTAVRAVTVKD